MNNTQIPFLLSRKEAAAFLGMSVNTFDRYIRPNPNLKSLMFATKFDIPKTYSLTLSLNNLIITNAYLFRYISFTPDSVVQ